MELTTPQKNTLKINSKRGYILVDPDSSEDAKIIIQNDNDAPVIEQTSDNLVIYGPGDFESSGILIKGSRLDGGVSYSIDADDNRVLLAKSTSISKLTDEDDYDAVVVKAVEPVEESALSAISTKLVVVYGDENNIPDAIKQNKVNKINLRKTDDLGSNVIYLEKK